MYILTRQYSAVYIHQTKRIGPPRAADESTKERPHSSLARDDVQITIYSFDSSEKYLYSYWPRDKEWLSAAHFQITSPTTISQPMDVLTEEKRKSIIWLELLILLCHWTSDLSLISLDTDRHHRIDELFVQTLFHSGSRTPTLGTSKKISLSFSFQLKTAHPHNHRKTTSIKQKLDNGHFSSPTPPCRVAGETHKIRQTFCRQKKDIKIK